MRSATLPYPPRSSGSPTRGALTRRLTREEEEEEVFESSPETASSPSAEKPSDQTLVVHEEAHATVDM